MDGTLGCVIASEASPTIAMLNTILGVHLRIALFASPIVMALRHESFDRAPCEM
jgi:hypothetical protein